jgi:hypothetical protein
MILVVTLEGDKMKPTRSIIKIMIILVILTAAAVPASQIYKTSVVNSQAVESTAIPLLISSSAHDVSQKIAGKLIPYQAKPWLKASTNQSYRADTIPYQAKPWLEPPARQGYRGDAIPYQAKPWLEPCPARLGRHPLSGQTLVEPACPARLPRRRHPLSSQTLVGDGSQPVKVR